MQKIQILESRIKVLEEQINISKVHKNNKLNKISNNSGPSKFQMLNSNLKKSLPQLILSEFNEVENKEISSSSISTTNNKAGKRFLLPKTSHSSSNYYLLSPPAIHRRRLSSNDLLDRQPNAYPRIIKKCSFIYCQY